MTDRERWDAIFGYRPFDRLPVYYFGQWEETAARWRREGWREGETIWDATGMDRDWGAPDALAFVRRTDFAPSAVAFDAAFQKR